MAGKSTEANKKQQITCIHALHKLFQLLVTSTKKECVEN